jgi:methionyl-tRNA formyltransferase
MKRSGRSVKTKGKSLPRATQAKTYLVLGCKPWNRRLFDEELSHLPGRWVFADDPASLTPDVVREIGPSYIFFLHWSWKVPDEIVKQFRCVCFHMSDVPYGRGGSPLQNLIARGHRHTKLTAMSMTEEWDAGAIYGKESLSLEGGAEEIFLRAGRLSASMIRRIVVDEPKPLPQTGKIVQFKRRTPAESEVREPASLEDLFDFIRMLDADGYPHAFLNHLGLRFEFSRAALYDGRIMADVTITPVGKGEDTSK